MYVPIALNRPISASALAPTLDATPQICKYDGYAVINT